MKDLNGIDVSSLRSLEDLDEDDDEEDALEKKLRLQRLVEQVQ